MSKVIFETAIGDIAGVVHGDKSNPLIMVLHGYGETSSYRTWQYIYKPLSSLGYLVVGIDMPGFGKSPGKRHKSRSEYMRIPGGPVDIVDNIINLLNKPSAYILGYDWGAGIAISAAIKLNNQNEKNGNKKINGLMLFHIAYTQQQENEIINYIDCNQIPTLILWVDVEQNHPIKVFNNEWKTSFKGCDSKIFECRPYSSSKPKNSYSVISDQIIETITKWINKNPPSIDVPKDEQKNEIKDCEADKESPKQVMTQKESIADKEEKKNEQTEKLEAESVNIDDKDHNQLEAIKADIKLQQQKDKQKEKEKQEEQEQVKGEKKKEIKKKKRKKTMSGIRIRRVNAERIKQEMKTDYGELVTIDTRGGKVVTVIYGDREKGKPYLALHGWGHQSWSRDIQWQFESLKKNGYFIIAPDMPGFGRSDGKRHSSRSETNFDQGGPIQIIEDILRYFGLNDKKINIYGYSWGGGIAISLALSSSIRKNIDKLVLFHPSYSEQKKNELSTIVCKKIIIIWIPTDLVHPIALGRYFNKVFPKHEYHELDCGKYVKYGDGKHQWEKHCDKVLPLILRFLKK